MSAAFIKSGWYIYRGCVENCIHLFKVISELHVLPVNAKDLETAGEVGEINVDFPIEATEAIESRVNGVRSFSGLPLR